MRDRIAQILRLTLGAAGVLGVLCLLPAAAWSGEESEKTLFERSNQNYRDGKYAEAVQGYEKLAQAHPDSAVFLYNLANSYYRTGEIGLAILNYERVLLNDPRHTDSRNNLEYARKLLEYRIEDKRNWYLRSGEQILEWFTEQEVTLIVLAVYFGFAAATGLALLYKSGQPWGWRRRLLVVFLIGSVALWGAKKLETRFFRDAIITAKEAEVRYGPSSSDQTAFRLGVGLKVYVVDRREKWSRIILVNGKDGWVPNDQLVEVGALR